VSRHRPAWPNSVADVLSPALATVSDQEAVVDRRRRLTYAELDALVDSVARWLVAHGVEPGDRLGVSLPNSVDVVVALLASMRTGALFVGVHPGLAAPEKSKLLADAGAALLLTTSGLTEGLSTGADVIALDLDDGGIDVLTAPAASLPPIDPSAPAAIAFTSGTTGDPKGVVHDQHHMVLPAAVIVHERLGGRGERVGVQLPLTTLNVAILAPILAFVGRGTCVCIDTHEPAALAAIIAEEGVEHLSCSPATVHDLVGHADVHRAQLAHLRLGVGGATCPEWLRTAYRDRFGRDFTTGYGLSEAPTSVTQETERVAHRPGASGTAMAHIDITILGDDGQTLPTGTTGEIAVAPARSGPWAGQWQGMKGYWRRPGLTNASRRGDLLLTGDQGWLDVDGYLHVADRRSDIINRGGSKVSPIEVERALREHPDVADCLVVGRLDDRLGEVVVAAVQARDGTTPTPAVLRSYCRSLLSGFKVPEEIRVVSALPRNPMGKIVRSAVQGIFDTQSD
jgi:long-chain acyl-CoA synthetase